MVSVGRGFEKELHNQMQECWKDSMSRIEFSLYFTKFYTFEQAIDNKDKFIESHQRMLKDFNDRVLNNQEVASKLYRSVPVKDLIEKVAHLKKNLCIINDRKVWLILTDNDPVKSSRSSFMSSLKAIDMAKGKTKSSINALDEYLKKNASIDAEISVILKERNVLLGTLKKSGEGQFFIPPEVNQKSDYTVDIPSCCKFVLSEGKEELKSVHLEGFDGVIADYKKLMEDQEKVEERPEVKDVKLAGEKR